MNQLKAMWARLSGTERLMIGAGIPLVALAAILSSRKQKRETPPPAAAYGTPQQFSGTPFDLLGQLDPIVKTIGELPEKIGRQTTTPGDEYVHYDPTAFNPIVVTVPSTPEVPRPSTPPLVEPYEHFPGAPNRTVILTGNDFIGQPGKDPWPFINTLALRIHQRQLYLQDPAFYEDGDPTHPALQIQGFVGHVMAANGWTW